MGACFSSASAAPGGAAERRPSKKRRGRGGGASPEAAAKAAATPVRVEFGYERDFEARYEVGRLLGHGQFGYTFAATDRESGDRVAVKRIDKAKVSSAGCADKSLRGGLPFLGGSECLPWSIQLLAFGRFGWISRGLCAIPGKISDFFFCRF